MHSLHINTSSTSNVLPELSIISMINPHMGMAVHYCSTAAVLLHCALAVAAANTTALCDSFSCSKVLMRLTWLCSYATIVSSKII
jgi:hypothetical protein